MFPTSLISHSGVSGDRVNKTLLRPQALSASPPSLFVGLAPINCARVAEIYQSLLAVPSRAKCFFEDLVAEPQTAIAPGPATPQPEPGHCRGEPCHRLATQHPGQLGPSIKESLTANACTRVVFQTG